MAESINGTLKQPVGKPTLSPKRKLALAAVFVSLAACSSLPVPPATAPAKTERSIQPTTVPALLIPGAEATEAVADRNAQIVGLSSGESLNSFFEQVDLSGVHQESVNPFGVKVDETIFDFVLIPQAVDDGGQVLAPERLSMAVDGSWQELVRGERVNPTDGQNYIVWDFVPDSQTQALTEPVLWYRAEASQIELLAFAPPSATAETIDFERNLGVGIEIAYSAVPNDIRLVLAREASAVVETDPMLDAAETLGADWGSLEKVGDQWIYDSPEGVIVGKDIEVTLGTLSIDGVDRSAILVDGEWPIALENESGEWEKTGIEYVDVTKPLVDAEGNPLPLTYKYLGSPPQSVSGFFVANREAFIEDDVEYQPIAVSLDGRFDSPMLTTLTAPGKPGSVATYRNGQYVQGDQGRTNFDSSTVASYLEEGEVFYAQFIFDFPGELEAKLSDAKASNNEFLTMLFTKMISNREIFRAIFDHVMNGQFDKSYLGRKDFWYLGTLGVSR
ncbi:MAG: hypothetical protein WD740_05395 [Anaerolineales bacterium]